MRDAQCHRHVVQCDVLLVVRDNRRGSLHARAGPT